MFPHSNAFPALRVQRAENRRFPYAARVALREEAGAARGPHLYEKRETTGS